VDPLGDDPGLKRVVDALIAAAVLNGRALIQQDDRAARQSEKVVRDAYSDIASTSRLEPVVAYLVSHPDPAVRLWAAALSMDEDPDRSRDVLRAIVGPLKEHAEVILRDWQHGWPMPRIGALYHCPVCGWPVMLDLPLAESLEICQSCGIQWGYQDAAGGDEARRSALHREWRERWIAEGMTFSSASDQPEGWDPVEQLRAVGIEI
jgi:hypothetical protein